VCGIAGIFQYGRLDSTPDRDVLLRMTRTLSHRGPDDEGLFVDGPIGFGHRRLSIVDLSASGHQPMESIPTGAVITYNGEIYNHKSLRSRLTARGIRFRGTSDTETLLYLIAEYGPRALAETAGIFAFGYWDGQARRLILARDPLGVKQLYYHDDGERVVFASEIKALLECAAVPREIDSEALNQYLHFHTPLFDRTFFKHIKQVRPGEYLEVDRNGIRHRLYSQTDGFRPRDRGPAETIADLKELLGSVVAEQLMSDVPVGAFFSGGIDSSAVAAFAKRAGQSVRCFGVHFTGQGVIDERPYQEAAARALGLDLELTTVDPRAFADDLMRLTYFQDQPVIGAAMIPMYHVSKLAARHVKVCLGGQAADEIFGGYARYALAHPGRVLASWFKRGTGTAGEPGAVDGTVGGNLMKQLADGKNLRRLARRLHPTESWSGRYFENFAQVPESEWSRIFPGTAAMSRERARTTFDDTIRQSPAETPGDKLLHWDIQTYLPGLFHQDDRMSMANGLESRVPIADPRIVRFALHTDFGLKLRGGASKWILRQAVADVIPASVLNRRKVGFDTPAESWMRGPHAAFVHDLLHSSAARSRGFWDHAGVARALANTNSPYWFDVVWKLASIEAWAATFLDTAPTHAKPELVYESA
jgi:asparagine synthase (glutamine-hydrolysing)